MTAPPPALSPARARRVACPVAFSHHARPDLPYGAPEHRTTYIKPFRLMVSIFRSLGPHSTVRLTVAHHAREPRKSRELIRLPAICPRARPTLFLPCWPSVPSIRLNLLRLYLLGVLPHESDAPSRAITPPDSFSDLHIHRNKH